MMDWDVILAPYSQVVDELKVKLKGIQAQFEYESRHSPIEFITGRVKPRASIIEKAENKEIELDQIENHIQDIAGLRIVCQDRKSTRLNSSHVAISYAVFFLKKKTYFKLILY